MAIQFWFEFASTYSYPAAMRIEQLAASYGITIEWRAFLLGPLFREQGMNDSPFNLNPIKGRYMWRDLERICKHQQISLTRPSVFPRNSLLAARVACGFADEPWLPAFIKAVYHANFVADLDISDQSIIERCISVAGQNPGEILTQAQTPAAKEKLRLQNEAAAKFGIFGAPSIVVGNELFWGNDRLEDALHWHIKHAD